METGSSFPKPMLKLMIVTTLHNLVSHFSILILTGDVVSEVVRLLQGMTWSGPLEYPEHSSSIIMILSSKYSVTNKYIEV